MFSKIGRCALALSLGLAAGARAESVYFVRITDMAKTDACEVMTREAASALQKEIAAESRVFQTALAAVKKAWSEDELTRKTTFPASRLAVRKMQQLGPFSREQAEKKKEKADEREGAALVDARKKGKGGSKEAQAKEAKRDRDAADAHEMLREKMKELLGREVPKNGF